MYMIGRCIVRYIISWLLFYKYLIISETHEINFYVKNIVTTFTKSEKRLVGNSEMISYESKYSIKRRRFIIYFAELAKPHQYIFPLLRHSKKGTLEIMSEFSVKQDR